jgi:hypothetical protein
MKKYLLGLIAVVLIIGFSAFSIKHTQKQTTYYWFETDSGTGDQATYVDADVTFYSGPSASAPTDYCLLSGAHKCIVGFTSSQINTSTLHLNSGSQTPTTADARYRSTQ